MIGDRWGVTRAEVERVYPCDAVVPAPVLAAWRGVDVAASPELVWAWVRMIRLAPFSYDWVDNLGRPSPRRLQELPDPEVGDAFTRAAGWPTGTVVAVEPGRALTGRILGAVMSYVVVPAPRPGKPTRLLLKIVMGRYRALAPLVSVGDLVMARRQLLNLADRAERSARAAGLR